MTKGSWTSGSPKIFLSISRDGHGLVTELEITWLFSYVGDRHEPITQRIGAEAGALLFPVFHYVGAGVESSIVSADKAMAGVPPGQRQGSVCVFLVVQTQHI